MRFRKLNLVVMAGMLLVVWSVVTRWTRVSRTDSEDHQDLVLSKKLEDMEREVARQLEENKQLLEDLRTLKNRKEDTNPVAPKAQPTIQTYHPDNNNNKDKDTLLAAKPEEHIPQSPKEGVLPILMIACDRVTVSRSLDKLLQYRKEADRFPIIVSQDCGHAETAKVIQKYIKEHNVTHIRQPDLSNINLPWPQKKFMGYYKIARHYKWALDQIFLTFKFSAVIIVEDDLDISPDFYEYFAATYPILKSDPELWCVSAWNDNGKESMVSSDSELLYRTDFFPGLGWMIQRKTWHELRITWPDTFWDDWMRHPEQRKGRQCIRPEICRTSTFGKKGVSKGLFYEKHLKFIKLNNQFVPFTQRDLTYLYKENYDPMFMKQVYSAPIMSSSEAKSNAKQELKTVRVEYTNKDSFKKMAKSLGIMDDFKAGVPRAAYKGVVSFSINGRRIYLAPPPTWKGYDTSWS